MKECNNPCKDRNCRDNDDHGYGLHCHHDHRNSETKRVQDEYTARAAKRERAIEWLTNNIDKLEQLFK